MLREFVRSSFFFFFFRTALRWSRAIVRLLLFALLLRGSTTKQFNNPSRETVVKGEGSMCPRNNLFYS